MAVSAAGVPSCRGGERGAGKGDARERRVLTRAEARVPVQGGGVVRPAGGGEGREAQGGGEGRGAQGGDRDGARAGGLGARGGAGLQRGRGVQDPQEVGALPVGAQRVL